VTVKGTVTEFMWEIRTDDYHRGSDDDAGSKVVDRWPAINRMEANGWTKTTVKPRRDHGHRL